MSEVGSTPEGVDVEIDWESAREANRLNWGDRAVLHEDSYGIDRFDDPGYCSDVVADDLPVLAAHSPGGSLSGLDLVHLQCHIGTDTISLQRAGATVTGVDFSAEALDVAARLAARTGTPATWVQSDVLAACEAVTGDFDVVYTSIGTICWLGDLQRWARQIAGLLRPGGVFYCRDSHPMMLTLDETREETVVRYRYFGDGLAHQWDDESTYSGDGRVAHPRPYEWPHPIAEVVSVLLAAGLQLERLDEGRTLPWQFAPCMEEISPGRYAFPGDEAQRVPCTFTVVARKPE